MLVTVFLAGCSSGECPKGTEKKCEIVKEPYTETESYEYSLKYGVVSDTTTGTLLSLLNYGTEQITKIKNFDEKGGIFKVKHTYRTLHKNGVEYNSTYLSPGETKDFITTFDTEMGEDVEVKTEVTAPSETRTREVIKYNEVERCVCE